MMTYRTNRKSRSRPKPCKRCGQVRAIAESGACVPCTALVKGAPFNPYRVKPTTAAKERRKREPRDFIECAPPEKNFCPTCQRNRSDMTRHHVLPRASGRNTGLVVRICRRCHDLAHRIYGPGNRYSGPETAFRFLMEMRANVEIERKELDDETVDDV